jgi:hypothetical protein
MDSTLHQTQLNLLLNDESIKTYFKTTNKNIFDFVKTYIEVDKILGSSLSSNSNLLVHKLDEIKNYQLFIKMYLLLILILVI